MCTAHTTPQAGLHAVYVCTDPGITGEIVLANIPGINGSGGCPEEYRERSAIIHRPILLPLIVLWRITRSLADRMIVSLMIIRDSDEDLETPYNLSYNVGNGITIYWEDGNDSSTTTYVVERYVDGGERTKELEQWTQLYRY